jgi:hypothetical protein
VPDAASTPSLPLTRYTGTYRDAWYGDVTISPSANGLAIRFDKTPALTGTLEHWQHDTFVARWTDRELRADAFVTFSLNPDGSIDRAVMRAVSPDTDFSYDFQDLLLRPLKTSKAPHHAGARSADRGRPKTVHVVLHETRTSMVRQRSWWNRAAESTPRVKCPTTIASQIQCAWSCPVPWK